MLQPVIKPNISSIATVLLAILFVLSIARVGYYFARFVASDAGLLAKGNHELRLIHYGDEYIFFDKVKDLPSNKFYITSDNGKAYFLGRYLLYPKKIFIVDDANLINTSEYLLLFKESIPNKNLLDGYYIEDEIRSDSGESIGIVLKKK